MKSDYLKPENYGKLFVFMQYANVLALRVTLESGMRIGDVLKIQPSDIKGRTIHYTAEKTGKSGRVVISQELANRLREYAGLFYVFPKRGKPKEHRTRQTVWRDVKKALAALRAAGVITSENITPHSARKTFAVEDMEKHGILHTQKALQHRDKQTTKIYTESNKSVASADFYLLSTQLDTIEAAIMEIFGYLENIGQKLGLDEEKEGLKKM